MSTTSKRRTRGFTIVELLIVIVVISILAAISITAYSGIQNRANDTAVKSDLRNFAGKILEYQAINGSLPQGGGTSGPSGLTFSVSRNSYATNKHNFIYCVDTASGSSFVIAAASKSGTFYSYSSENGLSVYSLNWGGVVNVCTNQGYTSYGFSYGYISTGTWYAWTQ